MNTGNYYIMKTFILATVLTGIIGLPAVSMAQNNSGNTSNSDSSKTQVRSTRQVEKQPETSRGDWALMFQIDKNFTLKDFSGALISFQKKLSDRNAIRWGLNLNGGYSEQRNNPNQKTTTGDAHIGVSMNYLWYAHISNNIRFYYGLGPLVAFGYNHSKNSQNSGVNVTKQTRLTEEVGLNGVAGVEWFVRQRISLLAEYIPALTGQYQSTVTNSYNYNANIRTRDKISATNIHFGPMPVRFGVAVYF